MLCEMDKVITTRKLYGNHGTVIMLFLFGSKYLGTLDTCGYRDGVDDDTGLLGYNFTSTSK
jgi:hypothetical protein